jgi:hypothetical protein
MVRFVDTPAHTVAVPEICAVGKGTTVTVAVPAVFPVQFASVTVGDKVYVVVPAGVTEITAGLVFAISGADGIPLAR